MPDEEILEDGVEETYEKTPEGDLAVTKPVTDVYTIEEINKALADIEKSNLSHQASIDENNANKLIWEKRLTEIQK